ncbi:pilus assembly protein [Ralstonia sp. A12]|uniref:PilW family protein n=1 Tax=Ralstonia sp. A12 TaxID=1217052 RepID=UPI0005744620|nr:PilW family protein [Ralstonia sp. A12]KHK56145.1 pilus assembly protein [Ralstonia sp. A12]
MSGKPMTPRMRWARRQAGTSLVEILIAMVIALFIMSGVVVMFVNMQKTFTSQDQLAQLQDNERLALTVLTNMAQSAGYFPNPVINTAATALPAAGGMVAGQVISGTTGTGTGSNSDTLTTQFAAGSGDGTTNCLGQTNTSGGQLVYVNTLSISANNELVCSVNGAAAVPIVSGVSGFSVLYGTDANNDGSVDSYLTATQVTTANAWPVVHTLKVTLTFSTQFGNLVGPSQTTTWTQLISLKNQP